MAGLAQSLKQFKPYCRVESTCGRRRNLHRPQQFHNDFTRHTQLAARQPQNLVLHFHHAASSKFANSFPQADSILPLNASKIDPRKLPQSQKELFIESERRSEGINGFDRAFSFCYRSHVRSCVVAVGPALRTGKGMRPSAEPEVRLPPPILEIVPRRKSRLGPIGDFVLEITGGFQFCLSQFIKLGHLFFRWNLPGAVPRSALQNFQSQPAPLVNFHHINGNVFRPKRDGLAKRLPPRDMCLLWKSSDKIETDVANPGSTKNRHSAINIFPPMHAARGLQLLIHKRLRPKAYAIESRRSPLRRLFRLNRLWVRFQRHFRERALEAGAKRVKH